MVGERPTTTTTATTTATATATTTTTTTLFNDQYMPNSFNEDYRTLHGRDQRKKCTLNFIKYTLSQPTASSTTMSALLHCNKALFVGNKAQLPTCLSVG